MNRKMSMSEARDYLSMTEEEQDQYDAYCEEQARFQVLFDAQEKEKAIIKAIELLTENGYKVEKNS